MDWLQISLSTAIKLCLMLIYAVSAYGLIGVLCSPLLKRWRVNHHINLQPQGSILQDTKRRMSSLELLLRATSNPATYTSASAMQFIVSSVSIAMMAYVLILVGSHGELPKELAMWWDSFSMLMALIVGMIPYSWRLIKLQLLRTANSYALIEATELMLMKFRTPGLETNLYHVLYEMAEELEGPMKRTIYSMVTLLQVEGKTAIYEAVELFEFQIKNTWSRQLGILMIKATLQNRNIERALQKLNEDMVQGKQIVEAAKSESMDAIIMGFIPLILVPSMIFYINHIFDGAIIKLLFSDPEVFKALVICILFIIAGLATSLVLSKPKIEV